MISALQQNFNSSPALLWITIIFAGLITFGLRLSFIALVGKRQVPYWYQRALRFVPTAVLSAIIFPELFRTNGGVEYSFFNARIIAGICAILIAWKTKSTVLTILGGMIILWLVSWLIQL